MRRGSKLPLKTRPDARNTRLSTGTPRRCRVARNESLVSKIVARYAPLPTAVATIVTPRDRREGRTAPNAYDVAKMRSMSCGAYRRL